ncbi:glycosyltransferase [Autumnicola musiva]|uniref:Glycosyltransferase n=1 Tax=Autumnicola musiva TaxID=3075589 RepID=A0ABU3D5Z5_9FLAO|nr:glycosyltransferase [Zunongwangia sp. F117]MDT0676804.1 glycosyltransferase [Zunongwangia sp. F117]
MPKILFKLSHYPQVSETFVTAQIVTAIKCGFDVQILVKKFIDFKGKGLDEVFEKYSLEEKIIEEKIKIPRKRISRWVGAFILLVQNIRYLPKILLLIEENKKLDLTILYKMNFYKKFRGTEIVHIQFGNNHQPFEILKKVGFINSKIIVSFHGHDAFFPIYGFIQPGYYDRLFKYGNLVVTNTPYLEKQVASLGCAVEKLISIPIGVDTTFFKPKKNKITDSDSVKIITVGRLDKVKGHEYGIMVIEKLIKFGRNVKFIIIGDGEERGSLQKILVDKQLEGTVNLVGKKNQEEVRDLLRSSDIYLFTGVPVENNRRETQGLATLEAQACGLPVVLFNSGGVKYTIDNGETGFLVKEYDVDTVVSRIELLMGNSALRKKMGQKAISFVECKFSQKSIDRIWCKTYNQLINE